MFSKNNKTFLNNSIRALFVCICIIRAQDTITFNDGMFATGAVKSVTADSVKLTASFTKEVVAVSTESVGAIQILGERYTFNKESGVWEDRSAGALTDHFTQITLGDDREISVLKYRGSPVARSSKGFSSVMDSIYRTNFYEMCYRGYNVEFSGEAISTRDILEPSLNKISQSMENPFKSGTRQIIGGFILLGWGIALTNIGILGISSGVDQEILPFIFGGGGMILVATIRISIGFKHKKQHDQWEEQYENQDAP